MIGIRQFFTRQNFPNPDSSKFSTVKILRPTVDILSNYVHTVLVKLHLAAIGLIDKATLYL